MGWRSRVRGATMRPARRGAGCSQLTSQADAPRSSQEVSTVVQSALATAAEAVEDPWLNAQRQYDLAADLLGLKPGVRAFLREAQRQLIVAFPVKMDDGAFRMFEGYRVQHNLARGPAKGGIYVLPSASEGIPCSLVEAIASGLPSVVSDIPGTAMLVRQGIAGWRVPVGDVP